MPNVDQRVVQMVFDKGNFESAVQSVIKTLDNLKKNLNLDKASNEFNKISVASKDVDMSSLANSVDTIASRFSNMGIIGMSVLNNLTNTAVNAGKSMLNAITSPIIEGGKRRALNLEAAKFQIQGLGKTWEDVYEDIDYAVSGTAYGLDAAARAAGQLLASSVETGPAMKAALRGISGVAAMTNSEYEDIANVFTTVAGNGKLMASELNRLSARGINAAAALGKRLNLTEAEVREMVTKGKIDFQTFADAMDYNFGEHATKANETFTGALSNMKAALARIGADFATPAYQHMRDVLNSLRLVAIEVKSLIAPLVTSATNGMSVVSSYLIWAFDKIKTGLGSEGAKGAMETFNRIVVALGTSLWNLYRDVRNIVRPIGEAFLQAFGGTLLDVIARAAEGIEQFTRSLALNERMEENLRKTFVGVFTILASVLDIIATIAGSITGLLSTALVNVFGFFVDILLNITAFLADVVLKAKEFIEWIGQLEVVQAIVEAISTAFENVSKFVNEAFENFKKFANSLLDSAFEASLGLFDAIGAAVKNFADWVKIAYSNIVDWINKVKELPIVQGTIERINDTFSKMSGKIRESASTVKTFLVDSFERARTAISNFVGAVRDLIGQYVELPSIQEAIAEAQKFVVDAFNNSKDIFEFIKEVVKGIIERVKELTGVGFEKVLENFAKLRDRIGEVVAQVQTMEGLKQTIQNVGNFFGGFTKTTTDFINQVKTNISKFIEWVKTKISGITIGEIIAAGAAGSFMAFFLSLASFLQRAKGIVIDFAKFSKEFSKIPKTLNDTLKSWNKNANYDKVQARIDAISGLVKSVALLAGALMLLSNVDPVRLIVAASVLGGLMAAMVLLSNFMAGSSLSNPRSARALANMGPMFLMLAGSVAILAVSLRMLARLDFGDILKGLFTITVALGALVGTSILISKKAGEATVGASTILALAGALLMMSGSLVLLSLIPIGNLFKAITAISVLLTVTALAARVAATGKKGSFAAIMGLALSMTAMIGALKLAASLSTTEFISGILRLLAAVGLISLLSIAISIAGPQAWSAGVAIGLISASFILLGAAFKVLATITNADIERGMTVLTDVMIVFSLMAAITRLAGANGASAGAAIAAMSGSMILIAAAIAILAQIDPDGLQRATDAVEGIIFMFSILIASTGLAGKATKTITVVAVAIAALAGAMAILALIEPANLMSAALAIDSLILSFSILVAATSVIKSAYKTIILLTLVVGALAAVIKALADTNPEGSLKVALGLSNLMLALSAAMVACAAIGAVGPAALLGIVVMSGVFLAILGLVSLVAWINQEHEQTFVPFLNKSIPVLEAIGNAIGSLFGSIAGSFLSHAASGIQTFGESLQTLVDALIPFIEQTKNIDESAMRGIQAMIDMVTALAAADFMNAVTKIITLGQGGGSLSALSEQLPQFGEALKAFSESLGDVDTGNLEKAALAGKALAEMAAAMPKQGGWMDDIFGTSNMDQFGKDLKSFGGALKDFGEVASEVKVDDVNKIMEPTRSLIELSNLIPDSGGFLTVFTGDNDFAGFGENLVAYGEAIKKFGNILGEGVNYSAISAVMQPTKDLIELSKTIDDFGGVKDAFEGADDLGSFGANLATFGGTFKLFSEKVSEIPDDALDKLPTIIAAVSALAEAAQKVPTTGGLAGLIGGDNNLSDFGIQLPNLGYGMSKFAESMQGVNPEVIVNSAPAIAALAEVGKTIESGGGIWGIITGNATKIKDFGEQLAPLGSGLQAYSTSVTNLNVGKIQESVAAIEAMSQAAQKIPGLLETLTRIPGIIGFPVMASYLGSGIKMFSTNLEGVDVGSAVQGAQAAEALGAAVQSMPGVFETLDTWLASLLGNSFSDACAALADGIKSFSDGLDGVSLAKVQIGVNAVKVLQDISNNSENFSKIKGVGENIKKFGEDFKSFYNNISDNIDSAKISEIAQNLATFAQTIQDFVDGMSTSLGENSQKLIQAASDLITGLTNTFITNNENVYNAAYGMVNQINTAIETGLAETSSKFDGVGERLIAGLVNGLRAGGDAVGQAVLFVMQWAIDTINGKQGEFQSAGQNLINRLADGMRAAGVNCRLAVVNTINDIEIYIRSRTSTFYQLGKSLMDNLCNGIKAGAANIRSAVTSAVNSAANNIDTSKFYSAGQSIAQGLADGMRSKIIAVTSAATELSRAASLASSATLQINSPSKVFMKIGASIGEGLSKGITNSTNMVEQRSVKLANSAVEAMAIVADTIDDQINKLEYEPKIKPVLDSSSLMNSIQGVNSIFGNSYGTNMATRALGQMNANSALALQNQNGIYDMADMLENKMDVLTKAVVGLYDQNPEFTMYIDGKQFASTTARSMNRALGSIAKRGGIT